ncbi:hypothetical protein [Streptomyces sp. NPDC094049]|uniref:hypothetical protein n=1 Tax=Streptomyces sp. NPDC094049 TaxID=3154987 RepID=UPI0033224458
MTEQPAYAQLRKIVRMATGDSWTAPSIIDTRTQKLYDELLAKAGVRATARQTGQQPDQARALTPLEHDRAWHAIESAAGAPDADPGTVLAAVLHALRINPPTAEDEQAASPRLRHQTRQEPESIEPQDHPGADLYVRLRKAEEDHDTAHALIYAHARMVIRQHEALTAGSDAGLDANQPTTDRAAILREAADAIDAEAATGNLNAPEYGSHENVLEASALLRRMADEETDQ